MAGRRYDNRFVFVNNSPIYADQFTNRNIRKVNQFSTPEFKSLEADDIMSLETRTHIWKMGDKFYKLAADAYGSPRLWWIIPWFNQKPLESDFKPGDVLEIPFPLSSVLDLFYKSNDD
tara:strand:+ start:693 stop:1046 length:354 start_codon:yes stop_codon:yes gene_type:complete